MNVFLKLFFLDFKQKKNGWIFYTSSNRELPETPKLLSWRTHSWYNIHEYIPFNQDNVDKPIFQDIQHIEILHPNPLDRSLWRLLDYKNEIKNLKETYADSGDTALSRCFIQVIYIFLIYFIF